MAAAGEFKTILREVWDSITDQDKIGDFQAVHMFKKIGLPEKLTFEAPKWFKKADKDGDNKLTFDELYELMNADDGDGLMRAEAVIGYKFKKLDKDDSGKLDKDEFCMLLRDLKQDTSCSELVEEIKKMDKDNDGIVDYNEFLAAYRATLSKKMSHF